MANNENLIAGKAARDLHAKKVMQTLEFGYKVQLLTSRVVMRLLATSQSNAATLLKRLEAQELIREINIKYSMSSRGQAYLLTPRGVSIAIRDLPGPLHKYDHRPESVRLDQSEHDLQLAEVAADWVSKGAVLHETDFIHRQGGVIRGKKIPDLILSQGDTKLAVEFERLAKSEREMDQMIVSAMRTSNMRTLWFFSVRTECVAFQAILDKGLVTDWTLNSSNKWVKDGQLWIPYGWRRRQFALRMNPSEAVGMSLDFWLIQFDELAAKVKTQTVAHWRKHGWRWGQLVEAEFGFGFWLNIENPDHDMQLAVGLASDNGWYVFVAGERPESGHHLGAAASVPKVLNVEPDMALVERAIRKVLAVDFDFDG